jgi:hypothetical protein
MTRRMLNVKKLNFGKCKLQDESLGDQLPIYIPAINVMYNVHGAGRNDFDAGKSISRAKSRFSGPTPSNGPSNGFAPIKIIKSKRHIKKICTLVILCTCFAAAV